MFIVTSHKCPGLNDAIEVEATDFPGPGGAYHCYSCSVPAHEGARKVVAEINFQNGPVKEADVNGVSIEALLAICQHRLECFQAGDFACEENAEALSHIRDAMAYLHRRTRARLDRGVEGTSQK